MSPILILKYIVRIAAKESRSPKMKDKSKNVPVISRIEISPESKDDHSEKIMLYIVIALMIVAIILTRIVIRMLIWQTYIAK